jgi:hypothetical protein
MPSSVIRRFSYDEAARRLRLTFVSGDVYDYDDVPPEVAEGLARAPSKGRFFGPRIRDRYPYRRVFSARGSSGAPPGP